MAIVDFFKKIFRTIWSLIKAYLIIVGLLVTLIPVGIGLALRHNDLKIGNFKSAGKADKDISAAILKIKFNGDLVDFETTSPKFLLRRFFSERETYMLPDLRVLFRKAAEDIRVKAVHIDVRHLNANMASLTELRRILELYKKSGKPLGFYTYDIDDETLYLASVGDRITLIPTGEVMIPGPTFQLMYFGDALKKLGVGIDVFRSGRYKSAFEPFVANKPSPETAEEFSGLMSDMSEHLVSNISSGRKVNPERVREWFRKTLYTPDAARETGIIDAVGFLRESEASLKTLARVEQEMDWDSYEDDPKTPTFDDQSASGSEGIALIEAEGEIHWDAGGQSDDSAIVPETMIRQIQWAAKNKDAKAVVLRISSPGGVASAADVIAQELKDLASKKPLIVSMGEVSASGGYWMSVMGKKVFAEPMTITGSIGVISMRPQLSAFEEKYGVSFYTTTQSHRLGLLNPSSKPTDEDRSLLDASLTHTYNLFLKTVAEGRHIPLDKVASLAQGRVYTGSQALRVGLIDELGGIQEAFQAAKELGGLNKDKLYPVLTYEEERIPLSECIRSAHNFMQCIDQMSSSAHVLFKPDVTSLPFSVQFLNKYSGWIRLAEEQHTLALWPAAIMYNN